MAAICACKTLAQLQMATKIEFILMTRLSKELYEVGYFLSRCGNRVGEGGASRPPTILKAKNWTRAYDVFYSSLSSGRTLTSFRNTLKNRRDLFDGYFDNGRVGWKDRSEQQPNQRNARHLSGLASEVFELCKNLNDEQIWRIVSNFADLNVSAMPRSVLSSLAAELEPNAEKIFLKAEGGERVYVSTRAERNPTVRNAAIQKDGTNCMVCGFSFEAVYGEWGKGFVEVHHLHRISKGPRETDPSKDLAVLCANCHRMIHRRRDTALTLDELRSKIQL